MLWKFPLSYCCTSLFFASLLHWLFGLLEISRLLLGTLEISSPKGHRKYVKCKWEYLFNYASTEFPLTADAIGGLMKKKRNIIVAGYPGGLLDKLEENLKKDSP